MLRIALTLPDSYAVLAAGETQFRLRSQQAASRALNKTLRWLRTMLVREVAQQLEIKSKLIRPGLVLLTAKPSQLTATLGFKSGEGVVKAKDLGTPRQTREGVRVGKRRWDNAFLATMPSGYQGIYKRKTKSRLPIREQTLVFTGVLAEAMEQMAYAQALRVYFQKTFIREFEFLSR